MYLDIVAGGLPFLPLIPIWHPLEDLSAKLAHFRVEALDGDARAEDLPRYVKNLHRIERDLFFVEESEIELPDWI
ncbi:MAG: hypothetical protein ABSH53_00120 [Holophaga sp.]|jgi:hypothetical protein